MQKYLRQSYHRYFGLTDLLTDDIALELSVIPSPPIIKFATDTFACVQTSPISFVARKIAEGEKRRPEMRLLFAGYSTDGIFEKVERS